ncbi:Retrovirus-related Pol polyprotein from transposon RE1-like protein [Drosera capensis]
MSIFMKTCFLTSNSFLPPPSPRYHYRFVFVSFSTPYSKPVPNHLVVPGRISRPYGCLYPNYVNSRCSLGFYVFPTVHFGPSPNLWPFSISLSSLLPGLSYSSSSYSFLGLDSSNANETLVPYPVTKNVVGCQWVYKIKYNSDGSVERYKARLVALGNHQREGLDFREIFCPVVKPTTTVSLVLSLTVSFQWVVRQLDVKNAFLHGHLTEEVYMRQPSGFIHPTLSSHVCRLHKVLYGLRQAPRAWFHQFSSFLLRSGFTQAKFYSSMFVYRHHSQVLILLLYVDDIVVTSSSHTLLS